MTRYFSWIPDEQVSIQEMKVSDACMPLFRDEMAGLERAVPRRIQEFTAGRECARRAMADLGHPEASIPANADRSPQWPSGIVGSITHSENHCAAVLARTVDGYAAIGIDLEPAKPLPPDLADFICLPAEQSWLDTQRSDERSILARGIFSAKECAYKAQYPISRQFLEFHELSVALDMAKGTFSARFLRDCAPFEVNAELSGWIKVVEGHIACTVILKEMQISVPLLP